MKLRLFAFVLGCAAMAGAGPALADIKFKFQQSNGGCVGASSCAYGNTLNASGVSGTSAVGWSPAKEDVTARAIAQTKDTPPPKPPAVPPPPDNKYIESAYLSSWSGGLGVQNRDGVNMPPPTSGPASTNKTDDTEGSDPEHAMDNNQRYEAILFSFDALFKMTGAEIGWPSGTTYDTDIFVMAYTGGAALDPNFPNQGFADLTSNGWKLVGNYADLAPGSVAAVNTGAQTGGTIYSSNHWLIGSYIPGLGGDCEDGRDGGKKNGCDSYKSDYGKVLALYGDKTSNGVPEPSALLLFGIALAGIWGTRRKLAA